jgi:hypothetical protein
MGWLQSVSGSGTGGGTQSITVSAGNAIVVANATQTGGATLSVADGQGSYTQVALANPGFTATLGLFVLYNANAGSHSVTVTGFAGVATEWVISEYSGLSGSTTGSNGQNQNSPGTGAGAITPGAFSANAGDITIGVSVNETGTFAEVAESGTQRFAATVGGFRFVWEDQIGSAPPTFTDATNGGSNTYWTVGASFKASAGAAVGPDGEFCFVM